MPDERSNYEKDAATIIVYIVLNSHTASADTGSLRRIWHWAEWWHPRSVAAAEWQQSLWHDIVDITVRALLVTLMREEIVPAICTDKGSYPSRLPPARQLRCSRKTHTTFQTNQVCMRMCRNVQVVGAGCGSSGFVAPSSFTCGAPGQPPLTFTLAPQPTAAPTRLVTNVTAAPSSTPLGAPIAHKPTQKHTAKPTKADGAGIEASGNPLFPTRLLNRRDWRGKGQVCPGRLDGGPWVLGHSAHCRDMGGGADAALRRVDASVRCLVYLQADSPTQRLAHLSVHHALHVACPRISAFSIG